MHRRLQLALFILAVASAPVLRSQMDDSPVVLDRYEVTGYLENYGSGNSFSALRVNAPLLDIPLSTSVITSQLMTDQALTDVNQAIRNIAGAQAVQGGSEFQNYYFTRGMPNFYYLDGIRMDLDGGNITPNVTAIDNIEVLKGPASILYGRGTPGGIVNFTSKRPEFSSHQLWDVMAGSYDHYRGDLDVTGPAGTGFAYRLIGTIDDANSYRDEVSNRTIYITPSATINLGKDSQLFLMVDYGDQQLTPDGGIATRPNGTTPAWVRDSTNFALSFNSASPRTALVDFTSARYVAELTAKPTPGQELRLMAVYQRFDHHHSERAMNFLDSAAAGVPGLLGPDQLLRTWLSKSGSRERSVVRLEDIVEFNHPVGSGQWSHQLLVSLDYGKTDSNFATSSQDHEIVDLNTGAAYAVWQYFAPYLGTTHDGQLIFDNGVDRSAIEDSAVAIQDNIKLSDSWRLLAGVRYEHNQADLDSQHENFILGLTPAPQTITTTGHATKGRFLPRLGLLVKVQPQLALFCNYLTSFIPAGGTQIGQTGVIDPETGGQFEAGLKYEIVPGRLFATASVFEIHRKDIATFYQDTTTLLSYWKASDEERSSGAEFELTGALTKQLNVVAHLGYLDNEVTDTDVAAKLGHRRHALSAVTGSTWATYTLASSPLKGLRFGFGVFYSGPQYLDDYNTVGIAARTLCDAMLAYGRDRWSVQLNVDNVFARDYLLPAGNGYNDPGYSPATYNTSVQAVIPGPGPEWRLRLAYAF